MTDRKFEMVTATDPADKFHRVRIRCSAEDCDETFIFARRGPINPVHAAKWFRDKGWGVGGHERSDLCPKHWKGEPDEMGKSKTIGKTPPPALANGGVSIKTRHLDIQTGIEPELDLADKFSAKILETPSEPVPVEAVPEMTRADKRIIHNKLDEVYADETTGYRGNWTDEKVAKDLGVPQQWVASIREDTYGPEISGEKRRREIDAIAADMSSRLADYVLSVEQIKNMIIEYDRLTEQLDRRLEEFEAKAAEMETVVAVYQNAMKELKGE